MRLSKAGILVLKGSRDIKKMIADALGISEATIYRYVQDNDDNLTKEAALKILEEETGLSRDQLIEEPSIEHSEEVQN